MYASYTIKCSVTYSIQQMMLNMEEKVEWGREKGRSTEVSSSKTDVQAKL